MNAITKIPDELRPGDILQYGDDKFTNELVKWKEGDPDTDHVEVYIGNGLTVASRNGIGVNTYQFNPNGLQHVRRPNGEFDFNAAMVMFATVKGAPYGWKDIEANAGISEQPEDAWTTPSILRQSGMDCSHFASLFLDAGDVTQFDPSFDARKITPRDFKLSLESQEIYSACAAAISSPSPRPSPQGEGELPSVQQLKDTGVPPNGKKPTPNGTRPGELITHVVTHNI